MERTRNVNLRLTETERKELTEKYQKLKFSSLSVFLRHLIFSKKVEIKFSPTDDSLAKVLTERNRIFKNLDIQISKIGVNINQVAKKVNSQQYVMREDINCLQEELKKITQNINYILEQK